MLALATVVPAVGPSGCVSVPAIRSVHPGLPAELLARAERGDAEAQYRIGLAYDEGVLVPRDAFLAARWLRRAAEQGHPAAASRLGTLYFTGRGLPRDLALALAWYRRGAEAGDAEGMAGLAVMLFEGLATERDPVRAFMWADLAAERGNAYARELRDTRIGPALTGEQRARARDLARARRSSLP